MLNYQYSQDSWPDYKTGNNKEWVITNGLGSFGSQSLIGSLKSAGQGLLIASLKSPASRYVVIEQVSERIRAGGHSYDLETSSKVISGNRIEKNGQEYLTDVVYDGTITYHYECGKTISKPAVSADDSTTVLSLAAGGIPQENGRSISHRYVASLEEWDPQAPKKAESNAEPEELPEFELTKYIGLARGENTLAIGYDFVNNTDSDATVLLTPWLNFRKTSEVTYPDVPKYYALRTGNTLSLVPREYPYVRIDLAISGGTYIDRSEKIGPASYLQTEDEMGNESLCAHYTPYDISTTIPPHTRCSYSLTCTIVQSDVIQSMALLQQASDCFLNTRSAHKIIRVARQHYIKLVDNAGFEDDYASRLVIAADQFIVKRSTTDTTSVIAGYPYHADRGRDAMLAFTGLTLCTKRYDDAGQLLFTYAKLMKDGVIPNYFPEYGDEPEYNSVDATLWYFLAVYKYLKYLRADEGISDAYLRNSLNYIYKQIFPCMMDIVDAFEAGTVYNIRVEENGLLQAGNVLDQVTWMDIHDGSHVITERQGAAVEVNALWYNALCVMEYLCKVFKVDPAHYVEMAVKVKTNFNKAFWNPDKNCLYDVVEYDAMAHDFVFKDDTIRPNQIYAVSLPFQILTAKAERAVVDVVERKLFVGVGLRTLPLENGAYHGQCVGDYNSRNEALHQGSAWSHLLGAFFTAYRKVNGTTKSGKEKLKNMFTPIFNHMCDEACVGGISELFDGDAPHTARGCLTQAWSVAEILRAYKEDVL